MCTLLDTQELNAAARAHEESLDATLTTVADAELEDVHPDNDNDSFVSVDDGDSFVRSPEIFQDRTFVEALQRQVAEAEGRLADAVSAKQRSERLLQESEQSSASLQAR